VTNGSLSSVPKTQATSVLPVAREESQRLSAGDFPEADFWPASSKVCAGGHNFRVARRLSAMAPDTAESTACRNMEKRFEASARIC
jgi:hypothetical protein